MLKKHPAQAPGSSSTSPNEASQTAPVEGAEMEEALGGLGGESLGFALVGLRKLRVCFFFLGAMYYMYYALLGFFLMFIGCSKVFWC